MAPSPTKRIAQLKANSCARKSGFRQCWAITLVAKGVMFLAIFAWLSQEFAGTSVFGITWPNSSASAFRGLLIFGAVFSSLQVVLGLYVSIQDCCPPQRKLAVQLGGYIGWIILTLCELPGLLAVWALSIGVWASDGVQAWAYPLTVGLFLYVTVSLIVTAVMAHSHRPQWEENNVNAGA